jgi:2-C-methyl-D-erythritol 4-phosphate cytidylyltransferase
MGGIGVVLPAAGSGQRMGGRKKVFLRLAGEPVLLHTLRPFLAHPGVEVIVVALPASDADPPPSWLRELGPKVRCVAGGATRTASVRKALESLPRDLSVAVVHDAARPLVNSGIIDRCVEVARSGVGAVAGWPVVDTLKEVDAEGRILSTPDRSRFWRAQTPQAFPLAELLAAYREGEEAGVVATDDAGLYALGGGEVRMVRGGAWNLKVTHPEDVALAEALLATRGGTG